MSTVVTVHGEILIFSSEQEPMQVGNKITREEALILNKMYEKRWHSALVSWISRNQARNPTREEIISKSEEIWSKIDLSSPEDGSDPVRKEAESLARELIERHLIAENFPIPSNLDQHIDAILDANPAILAQARIRVDARNRATEQTINAIRA